jgi:methyl-accepting chemotaxis protein
MKHLKVWQKMLVMGGILMLPFALVTYGMVSSINSLGVEFAQQEQRGVQYYRPLVKLLRNVQQHRGMTYAQLNGDTRFDVAMAAKKTDIDRDLRAVDEVDQELQSHLQTAEQWPALRAACRDLVYTGLGQSATQSFDRHTTVIANIIDLITTVSDRSNLTLDPDLDSYYLMNVLVFQAPELSEL